MATKRPAAQSREVFVSSTRDRKCCLLIQFFNSDVAGRFDLSVSEWAVLAKLVNRYNPEYGASWPSLPRIARKIGGGLRTVRRAVRGLQSKKLIAVKYPAGTFRSTTAYGLNFALLGFSATLIRCDSGRPNWPGGAAKLAADPTNEDPEDSESFEERGTPYRLRSFGRSGDHPRSRIFSPGTVKNRNAKPQERWR
jgi:hypothetical protein